MNPFNTLSCCISPFTSYHHQLLTVKVSFLWMVQYVNGKYGYGGFSCPPICVPEMGSGVLFGFPLNQAEKHPPIHR